MIKEDELGGNPPSFILRRGAGSFRSSTNSNSMLPPIGFPWPGNKSVRKLGGYLANPASPAPRVCEGMLCPAVGCILLVTVELHVSPSELCGDELLPVHARFGIEVDKLKDYRARGDLPCSRFFLGTIDRGAIHTERVAEI